MPRAAPRPCRAPNCPLLTTTRDGYCKEHFAEAKKESKARHKRYDKRRFENPEERRLNRFYKTSHWKRIRDAYIAKNPTCELCAQMGRLTVGTVVDHIVERREEVRTSTTPTYRPYAIGVTQSKHTKRRGRDNE